MKALLVMIVLAASSVGLAKTDKTTTKKTTPTAATVELGQMAPDFSLQGHDGKTYKLSDFKGDYVVLEWYNKDCPYVQKHYKTENMQNTQKAILGDKAAKAKWFSISTTSPGKAMSVTTAADVYGSEHLASTALLLDTDGAVGHAYDAKSTPHMFIINPEGKLVYKGAIDSLSGPSTDEIPKATNYVLEAWKDLKTPAKTVKMASTKPYGCPIKF